MISIVWKNNTGIAEIFHILRLPLVQYSFQISPLDISKGKMELEVKKRDTGSKQRWASNSKCSLLKTWPCSRNFRARERESLSACTHVESCTGKPPISGFKCEVWVLLTLCQPSKATQPFLWQQGSHSHVSKVNQQSFQTRSWEQSLIADRAERAKGSVEQAVGLGEQPCGPRARLPC